MTVKEKSSFVPQSNYWHICCSNISSIAVKNIKKENDATNVA